MLLLYVVVENNIGAEGAKALAASLEKNTSLTTLNLRCKRRGQGSVQGCKCAGCLSCVCECVLVVPFVSIQTMRCELCMIVARYLCMRDEFMHPMVW